MKKGIIIILFCAVIVTVAGLVVLKNMPALGTVQQTATKSVQSDPALANRPEKLDTDETLPVVLVGTLTVSQNAPIAYTLKGDGWTIYADMSEFNKEYASQFLGKRVKVEGDQYRTLVTNRVDTSKSKVEDFIAVGIISLLDTPPE